MSEIESHSAALNRSNRPKWEVFGPHRARVTALLESVASGNGALCVLGAGNCNDLDLPVLLRSYREVRLADIDPDALAYGARFQRVAGHPRLTMCTVDFTSVSGTGPWSAEASLADGALESCAVAPARDLPRVLGAPFEAVASVAVLSQIIEWAAVRVGEGHPQFVPLVQSLRLGHLRLMSALLAPAGAGVLINEVVSSETFPPLGRVRERDLPEVVARLLTERNFFTGLNPATLLASFGSDPQLAAQCEAVAISRPWLWDFGPRFYATSAIRFLRRASYAGR
jgi:hypothetical protein